MARHEIAIVLLERDSERERACESERAREGERKPASWDETRTGVT